MQLYIFANWQQTATHLFVSKYVEQIFKIFCDCYQMLWQLFTQHYIYISKITNLDVIDPRPSNGVVNNTQSWFLNLVLCWIFQ